MVIPQVFKGDVVLWFMGGHVDVASARPAVVTSVQNNCLTLSIFDSLNQNLMLRDGVRYHEDPNVKTEDKEVAGTWGLTERARMGIKEPPSTPPTQPTK